MPRRKRRRHLARRRNPVRRGYYLRRRRRNPTKKERAIAKRVGAHYHSGGAGYATAMARRSTTSASSSGEMHGPRRPPKRLRDIKDPDLRNKRLAEWASGKLSRRKKKKGRKAAARRSTTKRRRGKLTKAQRSAAARKGWRSRKKGRTSRKVRRTSRAAIARWAAYYRKRRRSGTAQRRKAPRYGKGLTKSRGRGSRGLRRARRTIMYQRAYGGGQARQVMRQFKMRTNPLSVASILDPLKRAAPVALSLYGAKFVASKVLPRVPGLDRLGKHADAVGSIALIAGAGILSRRVAFLAKRRESILLGFALNAIDTIARAYMPDSVKAQVGLGAEEDIYDEALRDYVTVSDYESELGDYVTVSDYESELGDYLTVGAEESLGAMAELGQADQIGTGIGAGEGSMVVPVPARPMTAAVPTRSFTAPVPGMSPAFDDMRNLYTGLFRGGFGC